MAKSKSTTLPTLYKAAKDGTVQFWTIRVVGNVIHTEYGKVGTESPQKAVETIREGKNIGKKNETTPAQQAQAEAESRWKMKLRRKGYTESEAKAECGERDSAGPVPMLAHKFTDHGKKMPFPCFGQPKMDGMRLLAKRSADGTVVLWTREGNILTGLPHINKAVSEMTDLGEGILDGELYNHRFKKDFERIISLCKQTVPSPDSTDVQFWVYDIFSADPYGDRKAKIDALIEDDHPYLIKVPTEVVNSPDDVDALWDKWIKLGYEGAMLRNPNTPYEHDRSYGLQKVKRFTDDEFKIVRIKEGKGTLAGHGVPICEAPNGKTFDAPLGGKRERLKDLLLNPDRYIGRQLTVKYFGWTKNGIPRHAKGKSLRDYE